MKIIVIDGPDGVGKTTLAKSIAEKLSNMGINAIYNHFPNYESNTGKAIKDCLYGKIGDFKLANPDAVHCLYAIDRWMWIQENKERYKDFVIVTDRYTTSSLFYQTAMEIWQNSEKIENILYEMWEENYDIIRNKYITEYIMSLIDLEFKKFEVPIPDISFYITEEYENIKERLDENRIASNIEKDNFENDDIFTKLVWKIGEYISTNQLDRILNSYYKIEDKQYEYIKKLQFIRINNEKDKIKEIEDSILQYIKEKLTIPISYVKTPDAN